MLAVLLPGLALPVEETLEGEGAVPVVPSEVFTVSRGSTGLLAGLQVKVSGICWTGQNCTTVLSVLSISQTQHRSITVICRLPSVLSRPADRLGLLITKHGRQGITKLFVREFYIATQGGVKTIIQLHLYPNRTEHMQ